MDFGAAGDGCADDTIPVQSAAAAAAVVRGTLLIPKGYRFSIRSPISIGAGTTVTGGGTIETPDCLSDFIMPHPLLSIVNADDVTVKDIILDANLDGQNGAWYEFRHMIGIISSDHVRVLDTVFLDPSGDAVYIDGTDSTIDCPRDVTVSGSRFFGRYANRGAIGLICGQDVRIENNYIEAMARPGMPGAIDVEPDNAGQVIRDVTISGNQIFDPEGCEHQTAISVSNWRNAPIENVIISGNTIQGCAQIGIGLLGGAGTAEKPVIISGNSIETYAVQPFSAGITAETTLYAFGACPPPPPNENDTCIPRDNRPAYVMIENNTVRTAAAANGHAMLVGIMTGNSDAVVLGNAVEGFTHFGVYADSALATSRLFISSNRVSNCGSGEGNGGIYLRGSDSVVSGNQVLSTGAQTSVGIKITGGTGNFVSGNSIRGTIGSADILAETGPQIWGVNDFNPTGSELGVDPPRAAALTADRIRQEGAVVTTPPAGGVPSDTSARARTAAVARGRLRRSRHRRQSFAAVDAPSGATPADSGTDTLVQPRRSIQRHGRCGDRRSAIDADPELYTEIQSFYLKNKDHRDLDDHVVSGVPDRVDRDADLVLDERTGTTRINFVEGRTSPNRDVAALAAFGARLRLRQPDDRRPQPGRPGR
jgi:hypothetical protein